MKVLQIYNTRTRGGAENLIYNYAPIMENKGLEVDILCLKTPKTLINKKAPPHFIGQITELSKKSLYNPLWIFNLIPILKKYDVIHAHLFPTLYWIVLAKNLSFAKTPIVYTEHSTTNRRRNFFVFKVIDRYIYKKLNTVVCITELVAENLKKHLKNYNLNYKTIENGIDLTQIYNAKPYNRQVFWKEDNFILIQASSFRYPKDQESLIKSLALLSDKVKLLLVGDGILKEECQRIVTKLGLRDKVSFLGFRDDVSQLLKTVDVVILSSHYEGLSLGNIEGMAAHKPFIGSDVPGIKEVVQNYGLLFEDGNSEELAELIKKLMDDGKFYKQIADQCYERAKNYDIYKMVDKYIGVYKNGLNP